MEKFTSLNKFNKFAYGPKLGFGPMMHCKLGIPTKWFPSDDERRFDSNWQNIKTRTKLEALGWTKNSIEYRRNDAGFRMDINMSDIKPGECDFYLGCSYTFGIGINLEDTWCWKMSLKRGLPCVNLGWGGGGIEVQYRLLKSWSEILRPKRVYTLGFWVGRREILTGRIFVHTLGPWAKNNPQKFLYETLNSNEDETIISSIRSFDAMRSVCMDYGIELYAPNNMGFSHVKYDHNARDLIHSSPSCHSAIANIPDNLWERLA